MMQFHTEVIDGEVVLTSVEGEDEVVTIPSEVTVIEDLTRHVYDWDIGVFAGKKRIREVQLPEGLKKIGRGTFRDCSSLQTIMLPAGLKTIEREAFFRCSSLQTIMLPAGFEEISESIFMFCSKLQTISLPGELKKIGHLAFADCSSLQTITLPDGLKEIEGGAFLNCSGLQTIALPEGLEKIGREAFEDCRGLQTITLTEGLKEMGVSVFKGCSSLQTITLPERLEEIGEETFCGCSSLQTITLPEGLKGIGKKAFYGCCGLQTIALPEGLKRIGADAFSGCSSLQAITLPKELKGVARSAFEGCTSLQSVALPEGLGKIGERAFSHCFSLTSITLPKGLEKIEAWTFKDCHELQSIILPEGLKEIGVGAFSGCTKLTSITLPSRIKAIDTSAFSGCTSLRSIALPEGLEAIETSVFSGCTKLKSIALPDGLKKIEENMFSGCTGLTSITLPEGLEAIGASAFSGCAKLISIALPRGLKEIGESAFSGCTWLTSIALPDGLKTIGTNAFLDCTSLKSITLPAELETLRENAFSGCRDLQIHVNLCTTRPLPIGIWSLNLVPTDEEIAWLWLYQNDKQWRTNLEKMEIKNPDRVLSHMVALQKESESKSFTPLVHFMTQYVNRLRPEQLSSTLDQLEEMKYRGIKKLRNEPMIENALKSETVPKESYFHLTVRKVKVRGLGTFNLCTTDSLPAELAEVRLDLFDEEIAYVALYQRTEKWKKRLNRLKLNDPVHVFNCMIELWEQDKSVTSRLTSFMLDHIAELQPEQVQRVISILQKRGAKPQLRQIMAYPEVVLLSKGEPIPEHPIEALVRKLTPLYAEEINGLDEIVNGVHYADSEMHSSRDAVVLLIAACSREIIGKRIYHQSKDELRLDDDVLRVARALNHSELSQQLAALWKKTKTQPTTCLLAWALLADDASIQEETKNFKAKKAGKSRPAEEEDVISFLMYNDSLAAMQLFDRLNLLDEYAQMRGMTAMEMRDSTMLPDFHFDADGAKRYDIGGNTIEVRITPELKFQLFDGNKGKELRSFPKKSDDPEKLAACAAEFDSFKKEALSLAKERAQLLHKLHMSGEFIRPELWRKAYVEHPLVRILAQLVVWEDEAKRSFMTVDGETIDSQGQPYSPQGAIRVAHVLDMTAQDIAAWQLWLTRQGKKQLFEQVWEPVIHWNEEELRERYKGIVVSSSARNAVKKRLAQRGVDMWAEDMDRSYDSWNRTFEFSNRSVMHFGHCLALDYEVDEDSKETTFGSAREVDSTSYRRELNAVLLEMDRAAISAHILKDDDAALTDAALASFTAAQISEFLNLAIDQKRTRCTTKLLDYKNQRFPEFSEVDEFTLDW